MRLIVGLTKIKDTQCGFKFFQAEIARHLFERQRIDGYMFDVEILYLASRAGFRIEQLPVRWRDDNDSRFRIVSGGWRVLRELITIRLIGLLGVYDQPHEKAARTITPPFTASLSLPADKPIREGLSNP